MTKKCITITEFKDILDEMATIWPSINATARVKRYFATIADLETNIVLELCNDFIDRYQKLPLPQDFLEKANRFKSSHLEKFGYHYGSELRAKSYGIDPIQCADCLDSGFLYVSVHKFPAFCFCYCEKGKLTSLDSVYLLPKWTDLKYAVKSTFPHLLFKPKINLHLEITDSEFLNVVDSFKKIMLESQTFWASYHKENTSEMRSLAEKLGYQKD